MIETIIATVIVLAAAIGVGYALCRAVTGKSGCEGCRGCATIEADKDCGARSEKP